MATGNGFAKQTTWHLLEEQDKRSKQNINQLASNFKIATFKIRMDTAFKYRFN